MLLASVENSNDSNGISITVMDHRQVAPLTSFLSSGPTLDWILNNGYLPVRQTKNYNEETEKVVGSEPYIEDDIVYIVDVLPKTETELAEQYRARRDSLLSATDWRFRSDLIPSQEWIDYCQALRDIPQQDSFPYNIIWPIKPDS